MADNKVLIIDDDPVVRILVEEFLGKEGYQVNSLASGAGASEVINRTSPNFVVLDYLMPDITGIEVLRDIRANSLHSKIPVLLLSSEKSLLKEAEGIENTICMEKPFTMEQLLNEMSKLDKCRSE